MASRTRSAWWMLVISVAGVVVFGFRLRDRVWWRMLGGLAFSLIAGVVWLRVVPNRLEWISDSPYLSSLASMASFERSNGRAELWRVGRVMIARAPVAGIGTGNYPPLWRDSIQYSDVRPRFFGFLRADLPLYNDYLQDTIENGLPGGLLSLAVRLGLPLLYLWRIFRLRDRRLAAEALLCIGCVALSLDALVDYPFGRPETLLVFAVTLALVERGVGGVGALRTRLLGRRAWWACAATLALLLTAVLVCTSVGLGAKKLWAEHGSVRALRVALHFWPWDEQWKLEHLIAFADAKDTSAMQRFAELRMRAWPTDPESHLIQATLLELEGDFAGATDRFRRAVVSVANGRCYPPAYAAYRQMVDRPDFPPDVPRLGPELASCSKFVSKSLRPALRRRAREARRSQLHGEPEPPPAR